MAPHWGNPQTIPESSCGFQHVHTFCQVKTSMPTSAPPSSLRNLYFSLAFVTKDQMQFLVQKKYNTDTAASDCAGWESSKNLQQTQGTATSRAQATIPVPALQGTRARSKRSDHVPSYLLAAMTAVTAILQHSLQQNVTAGTIAPCCFACFRSDTPRFCTRDFQRSRLLLHYGGFAGSKCLPFHCRLTLLVG